MAGSTRIGTTNKSVGQKMVETKAKQEAAAEAAFQKLLRTTKVTDLDKARNQIYKKYGVWPNGGTN